MDLFFGPRPTARPRAQVPLSGRNTDPLRLPLPYYNGRFVWGTNPGELRWIGESEDQAIRDKKNKTKKIKQNKTKYLNKYFQTCSFHESGVEVQLGGGA